MTDENLSLFSRVSLCQLSSQFPQWIDAKFTVYFHDATSIPYLQQFKGEWVSFEEQLQYKYHIFIDGYVAPFSNSGWKFFSNSVIFKPASNWTQWYFDELQPYIHYIPVQEDLKDLIANVEWILSDDETAEKIAQNAREFALTHLTLTHDLVYLYLLIQKYSQLKFE